LGLLLVLRGRSKLVAVQITIAGLIAAIVVGPSATMVIADQSVPEQGLGSANDYVNNTPDSSSAYEIPLLGIEVNNSTDGLKDGHKISGVGVLSAIPESPGAAAGLQGRREGVQTALTVGILAGAMFFPPAMLGVIALQQSGVGQSHDLIIAVDGQRTRDITDFEEVIEKAQAGEFVYLTVLRNGAREQLRVELPVACLPGACRETGAGPTW